MELFIIFVYLLGVAAGSPVKYRGDGGRIVGGHEAVPHSAPYMISLRSEIGLIHQCGGSLITVRSILSAARCFVSYSSDLIAVAGDHSLRDLDPLVQQHRLITAFHVHPNFTDDLRSNDIAVANVLLPFTPTINISLIALPVADLMPVYGSNSTLFGWGSISNTTVIVHPNVLQVVNMEVISMVQCHAYMGQPTSNLLTNSNLCTGPVDQNIAACIGDDGGPLVQLNNVGILNVIGLVSWGLFPCRGRPSVFTRVSAHIPFIQEWLVY